MLQAEQSALHGPAGSCAKLDDWSHMVSVLVIVRICVAEFMLLKYSTTSWWRPAVSVFVAETDVGPWKPAGAQILLFGYAGIPPEQLRCAVQQMWLAG